MMFQANDGLAVHHFLLCGLRQASNEGPGGLLKLLIIHELLEEECLLGVVGMRELANIMDFHPPAQHLQL